MTTRQLRIVHIVLSVFPILTTIAATMATTLPPGEKAVAWLACAAALGANLPTAIRKATGICEPITPSKPETD